MMMPCTGLLALLLALPLAAQNVLRNPGFEPPEVAGLAEGWVNNTWGDCTTVFSLDENAPHSGKTCQKIECVRRAGGASQFLQPLQLQAAKLYRVKLWVRAAGNVPWVGAVLRQSPSPYRHHVAGRLEPGPDWELLEFEGVTLDPEQQAGLYIWFEADGSGTVWVDDASVEVMDAVAPGGPPPEGNVVPNGSFEVNPARTWDSSGPEPQWPCTDCVAHGLRSLHFVIPEARAFNLNTPCLVFNGNGEDFTLALSARATGGPVHLEARLNTAARAGRVQDPLLLTATPDGELRRYSTHAPVPSSLNGAYFVGITVRADGPAELWLDAVSVSRDGPDFSPAAPLEAALSTQALAGIFAPDEPITVTLETCSARAESRELKVTVCDYEEAVVCAQSVQAPAAVGLQRWDLTLPVRRLGAFRADVAADSGPPLASLVFSVVPRPAPTSPEQSVVGGHFSTASDWQMRVAQRLGYKWTRIHDCSQITHWRTAEPEQGRWRFFDDEVRRVRQAGLSILGEFLRVPDWATLAEKGSQAYSWGVGPFRDMGEFERYVRTVVDHYKADIHCWEIWNEPYGDGFWGGTAQQYADLAKVAARTAKAADPTCSVLAPCITPHAPDWAKQALAAGALDGSDIFSYHGYGCLAKSLYDRVTEWATRDGQTLPIWNTETGVTACTFYRHVPDKLDDSYTRWIGGVAVEEAVAQSLKLFVLALASGSERYFYYWTNVESGMCPRMTSMSIYEYDRTIRPHGVVYAIAGTLLDPCEGAGVRELPGGVTACLLERQGEAVVVVWAKTKLSQRMLESGKLPPGTRVLDAMGNPLPMARGIRLTKMPVYLIGPVGSAEDMVAALG